MDQITKSKRGGARAGAGRKCIHEDGKKITLAVRISPKLYDLLSKEPNKAAVLEKLLSEYYQI